MTVRHNIVRGKLGVPKGRTEEEVGLWLGAHVLRKTCGTRIADGGGGVAAVASHLRHKSLQTASRYIDRRGASARALRSGELMEARSGSRLTHRNYIKI